jgi:hypothetical protein
MASARPQRLVNLAETTDAIADALLTRAGWIEDDWQAYSLHNAAEWRFDLFAVPDAVRAWARTLRGIGEFAGAVGAAFLEADSDGGDDVHDLNQRRLHRLLSSDLRDIIDESRAARDCSYVDWGEPDDPPPWLEALQVGAMVVGHVDEGVDALATAYVIGKGSATRWSPETPAVLGRFATPTAFRNFSRLFGAGSAALSGTTAALTQQREDAASLNYTDDEIARRSTTRGVMEGGGALVTGVGGWLAASAACGPGAPVCAVGVIVVVGTAGNKAVAWVADRFIDSPDPAEHDHEVVEDRVDAVAPGTRLRDTPDWMINDVIGPVENAGEGAGAAAFEARHPYLDRHTLADDLALADEYGLPDRWVLQNVPLQDRFLVSADLTLAETP